MQIHSLECLAEIKKAGSLNKAAKNLYISQQGLGKLIDSLEAELGCQLIERTYNGVRLTECGFICLRHADAIIGELASMKAELVDAARAKRADSPFELVADPYTSLVVLGRALSDMKSFPHVSINEWNKGRIAEALQDGIDKLFLLDWVSKAAGSLPTTSAAVGSTSLQTAVLFDSHFGIVCHPSSNVAQRTSIALEDVAGLPLACYNGKDYCESMDEAFGTKSLANIVLKTSNANVIISFLLQNQNVAQIIDELTYLSNPRLSGNFAFVPFDMPTTLTVGFAFDPASPLAPSYRSYIDAFRETTGKAFPARVART